MKLRLVKRRWSDRFSAELDIQIVVLFRRRCNGSVTSHRIPEGAEESSVGMSQPHVQIVAESCRTYTSAGADAGFPEPDHEVAEDADRVAAVTLAPAPGQRDADFVVRVRRQARVDKSNIGVPDLGLLDEFVVLRDVEFGDLDVGLWEVEPARAARMPSGGGDIYAQGFRTTIACLEKLALSRDLNISLIPL